MDIAVMYSNHATVVLRPHDERRTWLALRETVFPASRQIVVHSDRLGTFVASL